MSICYICILYCEVDMSIWQKVKKTQMIIKIMFNSFQTAMSPHKLHICYEVTCGITEIGRIVCLYHHHAVGRDATKTASIQLTIALHLSLCCESDVHESVFMYLSFRFLLMYT